MGGESVPLFTCVLPTPIQPGTDIRRRWRTPEHRRGKHAQTRPSRPPEARATRARRGRRHGLEAREVRSWPSCHEGRLAVLPRAGAVSGAPPALSVVVTTYAWPEALDAVLRGLAVQRGANMEVVVAEDASSPETAAVVHRWQGVLPSGRLRHVTQEDEGFRLARVRDLGALAARGTAVLFLDGDCVPRAGLCPSRAPPAAAGLVPRQ